MKSINDLIWDPSASSDCGSVARIGEGCHDDGIMASCGWPRCSACGSDMNWFPVEGMWPGNGFWFCNCNL